MRYGAAAGERVSMLSHVIMCGGEHTGDIKLIINDKEYIVEVKYRAIDGFPNPFKVLDNRDIALYKRKTGDPRWVIIIPDKIFKEILK